MNKTNENQQNILARKVLVTICLSAVLGLAGCEQEGTAEQAGRKIDRAAEKVEQKTERAIEKADQKIDAAKESLGKQADKAGKIIDESTDASKDALEKGANKMAQATENATESVTEKAQTAGEYIDDSVITIKVKAALLNDPLLKSSQIEVTTVNGVVKLSGTIESEQSIGRAMKVASSQQNVKSVQNELIVKASSPGK